MDASVEHLLEITRGVSQVGVASERKKSTSIIEVHFRSLRIVLLAFYSVWFPHIIDINYIVIKIRINIKHSFYQQQGKKRRSYSQIFDSVCPSWSHVLTYSTVSHTPFNTASSRTYPVDTLSCHCKYGLERRSCKWKTCSCSCIELPRDKQVERCLWITVGACRLETEAIKSSYWTLKYCKENSNHDTREILRILGCLSDRRHCNVVSWSLGMMMNDAVHFTKI